MRRPRILIADDHALLAEGIAGLLRSDYEVVGVSPDGRQLLSDAERLLPDLVTLDIGMPLLNGLEAARQLQKLMPKLRVVFVTQHIDVRYLRAALAAGALAFVAKQSASSELLTAVRRALLGKTFITPLLAETYAALGNPGSAGLEVDAAKDPLTARQREVLQLIAEGHTTRVISETLHISPKTVEFHKTAMISALGVRTTADLIRYALSEGIVSAR